MLYWLAHLFSDRFHFLRVFQYLTFRSILGALTALLMVFIFSPRMITYLRDLQISQTIRTNGPQTHLRKKGTPTMGGVLIILAISISLVLWGDLSDHYIWCVLVILLGFGFIGWIDDYRKVIKRDSIGLPARWKFTLQSILGLGVACYLYFSALHPVETELVIPFLKNIAPNLGLFYIALAYVVIVGGSNSVNLTDGLDGLALLPTIMIGGALGIFAYIAGNHLFAEYLTVPYIPGVGELVVFSSALSGAGIAFLWYNTYPAEVFMGDVGSLGLGAALGVMAVMIRQELVFMVMGGIFVVETLSVILQVGYFKLSGGKRIFLMAPLHHHFELKGWPEPRIIVRFWTITFILVLCGLATLKLR